MIKKHIDLMLGIGLFLISSGSSVLTAGEYIPTFFDMDKDGDGAVSSEEAHYWSALRRAWRNADANQDGVIDMQEWNALDTKALADEDRY
jgi:hypothetical protein